MAVMWCAVRSAKPHVSPVTGSCPTSKKVYREGQLFIRLYEGGYHGGEPVFNKTNYQPVLMATSWTSHCVAGAAATKSEIGDIAARLVTMHADIVHRLRHGCWPRIHW